ncbi:hypothetical protein MTQ01_00190 [Streptomyces sp. XM4193]|uniref:hypothetical protein n=1 Tax=Streptomyces sp. XM4193 TaxID=2929782 RepID=UPI001FF87093|nr:hypothetical protein [Streptomyces sp. XM4193]MCK1794473.1 hypothetical protein [Streptomyces sp. XM4193]
MAASPNKVDLLPGDMGSLSRTIPPALPNTLFVLGPSGGMSVAPDVDFTLVFGRSDPDVHVCVGAGDGRVSRRQGLISRRSSRWVLHNTGRLPIRFPRSQLVLGGQHAELMTGYTPLFVVSSRQEHLLEVRITTPGATRPPGSPGGSAQEDHEAETHDDVRRELKPEERLVLVCLAQRYLRGEPQPQPLAWSQVAHELAELQPDQHWSAKRAAHIVAKVRKRLSTRYAVPGLTEEEVTQPVGNALNHNLITDLLVTTTLGSPDLHTLNP